MNILSLKKHFLYLTIILAAVTFISSCDDEEDKIYSPKPRGYFRIDFPKKEYRVYDSICPYSFEMPLYSHISQDKHKGAEPCWLNLEFPKYKATVHLSYKEVNNNINLFLEQSRDMAVKHQVKATGLDETIVIRDSARVFGLVYDIEGNTASNVQFYLTDSTRHFIRGALYFNSIPNIDSLKIVIDFLRKDILQMVKTLKWKDLEQKEAKKKKES